MSTPILRYPLSRHPARPRAAVSQLAHRGRRLAATRSLVRPRWARLRVSAQAGMTTAEYAVGTLAACTFAVILIAVVRSGAVRAALSHVITTALALGS